MIIYWQMQLQFISVFVSSFIDCSKAILQELRQCWTNIQTANTSLWINASHSYNIKVYLCEPERMKWWTYLNIHHATIANKDRLSTMASIPGSQQHWWPLFTSLTLRCILIYDNTYQISLTLRCIPIYDNIK